MNFRYEKWGVTQGVTLRIFGNAWFNAISKVRKMPEKGTKMGGKKIIEVETFCFDTSTTKR